VSPNAKHPKIIRTSVTL